MKYIGLDLGSKTVGIAISDEFGILARHLETYRFSENDYNTASKYVIEVAKKNNVEKIVLGLPKHMNGDIGIRANISYEFKEKLEKANLEVYLQDERLTTSIVDKTMIMAGVRRDKRKQLKDEMAAVVILQNFLDRRK